MGLPSKQFGLWWKDGTSLHHNNIAMILSRAFSNWLRHHCCNFGDINVVTEALCKGLNLFPWKLVGLKNCADGYRYPTLTCTSFWGNKILLLRVCILCQCVKAYPWIKGGVWETLIYRHTPKRKIHHLSSDIADAWVHLNCLMHDLASEHNVTGTDCYWQGLWERRDSHQNVSQYFYAPWV